MHLLHVAVLPGGLHMPAPAEASAPACLTRHCCRRHDNIQGRIEKKKDKRKERRENKLLRAGFEGRKEGFIATTAGPAAAAAKK